MAHLRSSKTSLSSSVDFTHWLFPCWGCCSGLSVTMHHEIIILNRKYHIHIIIVTVLVYHIPLDQTGCNIQPVLSISLGVLCHIGCIRFYQELYYTVKPVLEATSIKEATCIKRPMFWFPIMINNYKFI